MSQLSDCAVDSQGRIMLPFGAQLVTIKASYSNFIVFLDKRFAVEWIGSEDVTVDTDKLITTQTNVINISYNALMRCIYADAIKSIKLT